MGDEDRDENEQFVFEAWIKDSGLSVKASQVLKKEELVSSRALAALTEEDIVGLGLPLGQRKLLQLAVTELCHPSAAPGADMDRLLAELHANAPAASTTTASVTLADLRKQAGALHDSGKTIQSLFAPTPTDDQPTEQHPSPAPSWFDPRLTLTVKARKKKAVHITDFLHERTKKRRQSQRKQFVLSTNDTNCNEKLVIQPSEEHPYSGIFVSEWAAANCRLMNHLLVSGELLRSDIEYYLAHTVNIMDYVNTFEWESILQFDFLYREMQAEHGFPWGTYPPNMEYRLIPKATKPQTQTRHTGPEKIPDCKMFKARGSCSFGSSCKYRHVPGPHQAPGQQQSTAPPPPPPHPPHWSSHQEGQRYHQSSLSKNGAPRTQ
jgi:hypothetical protein